MEPNLKKIKAIAYDIDGVATDGSIIPVGPDPEQLVRIFNAKDSFASNLSSPSSPAARRRRCAAAACTAA